MTNSKLRDFVSRIENLEKTKRDAAEDIREVYSEAQGAGFVAVGIRALIRKRKEDSKRRELIDGLVAQYQMEL